MSKSLARLREYPEWTVSDIAQLYRVGRNKVLNWIANEGLDKHCTVHDWGENQCIRVDAAAFRQWYKKKFGLNLRKAELSEKSTEG